MNPAFLTLEEVLALHADQIRRYGGAPGLRDRSLLESALATPRTTFDDELLHPTLPEMAGAYLYHLARNHPFVDGNKRTALACALAFLWLNGLRLEAGEDELVAMVAGATAGRHSKAEVSAFLAARVGPRKAAKKGGAPSL